MDKKTDFDFKRKQEWKDHLEEKENERNSELMTDLNIDLMRKSILAQPKHKKITDRQKYEIRKAKKGLFFIGPFALLISLSGLVPQILGTMEFDISIFLMFTFFFVLSVTYTYLNYKRVRNY